MKRGLSGNKIVITGGGSGIGFGLAERFVSENNSVILVGRREEVLKEAAAKLPTKNAFYFACDISNAKGREELSAWVEKHHSDTNVLLNNAGVQNYVNIIGAEKDKFVEQMEEEISINIEAPLHLTNLFLANNKNIDTIMMVTSGLAFIPMAKAPIYSATKAFLHSYTLSLRAQMRKHNNNKVAIVELIPPALNTDLGGKGKHDGCPPVSAFVEDVFKQLKEGKEEVAFGFAAAGLNANAEDRHKTWLRLNELQ